MFVREDAIPKPQPFFQKLESHENQKDLWKDFLAEVNKIGHVLFAGHVVSSSSHFKIHAERIG